MYCIIDIETTGGSPGKEKITEIAIYQYNGQEITGEFSTLINPEKNIPYFITQLTGISNKMVASAPKFYEVAKKIVELTEGKIFVAHNVNFDFNFVKSEFDQLGYQFTRDKLCTVQLSRKIIPGRKSYSLGNLCKDLDIRINGRHRAAGDALATLKLFQLLQEKCLGIEQGIELLHPYPLSNTHPALDKEKVRSLPELPGIYYLLNEESEIVYIGKSVNLRQRVLSHFYNNKSKRAIEMKSLVCEVDHELTGNELVASLLESAEIKKHKPLYNRRQRRTKQHWGMFSCYEEGYLCFRIEKTSQVDLAPIKCFDSKKEGINFLYKLIEKHELCQKLCGLYPSGHASFHYQVGTCHGACVHEEAPGIYNARAREAIGSIELSQKNIFIIDKGRHPDEKAVIHVQNGKYSGFGYCTDKTNNIEILKDCISRKEDNHEVKMIIKQYLEKQKAEQVIIPEENNDCQ